VTARGRCEARLRHKLIFEHLTRLTKRGHWTKLFFVQNPHVDWFEGLEVSEITVTGSYDLLTDQLRHFDGKKIATWWRTARPVSQSGGGFYYVQDVEHGYALSTEEYQAITGSYHLGLRTYTESQWVADELGRMGVPTPNVGVGIDRKNFYPHDEPLTNNEVLFHNRAHHLKGPELRNRVTSMQLGVTFVGYSPWGPHYMVPNMVHFHNPTDAQLGERMRHALALLVTSTHEGFCLPAAEAMACGIPVVTTPADGNTFCRDGYNCLLGRDAIQLANAIQRLRADRELWLKLREGALETAEQWNWNSVIDKVELVLDS
jgi:glycosyltransferase involved in cell wall biosynthesis